ncbi:MAG: phosphoesterase, partial [Halobacteriaceae archaeon]
KQSDIVRAQGKKQSQILEAQGDAISTVLRARSAESMGERAVIERGIEALEHIGEHESTTFVIPQELSSLVGRYGKHLAGSDVTGEPASLDSLEFDEETRELLGLDEIDQILSEMEADVDVSEMEGSEEEIPSPDEVIEEMDAELNSSEE